MRAFLLFSFHDFFHFKYTVSQLKKNFRDFKTAINRQKASISESDSHLSRNSQAFGNL